MRVKSIAECSGAFCNTFDMHKIKLPNVTKIFFLSIFEWPFYTCLLYTLKARVLVWSVVCDYDVFLSYSLVFVIVLINQSNTWCFGAFKGKVQNDHLMHNSI